ncbi:MAG: PilZ domain-containing protein [Thiotrichaceae bacterium]|nr:PilZ domain-containing protein [Thiotrichaceae bacterium]
MKSFMPDNPQETLDIDNLSDLVISDDLEANRRTAVRYVRGDIKASLKICINILFVHHCNIQLIDLSTKGALIFSDSKIRKNKKLTLILEFEDGRSFEIKARMVRLDTCRPNTYGIKFDKFNDALGEYIFKTQTNLIFK